jgi:hypothetical protein
MSYLRNLIAISTLMAAFGTIGIGSASASDTSVCVDGPEFGIGLSCVGYSADQGSQNFCVYGFQGSFFPQEGAAACGGGSCDVSYDAFVADLPHADGCQTGPGFSQVGDAVWLVGSTADDLNPLED